MIHHGSFDNIASTLDPVDLIFADPPFNAGKAYGSSPQCLDAQPPEDYRAWLREQIECMVPLVKDGGTLWLMNETRWIGYCQYILDSYLTFQNMVAWVYTNPTPSKRRFPKSWRPILVYSRGEPRTWNQNAYPMEKPTLYFNPERREKGKPFVHDVWSDIPKLVGGFLAQPELIKKENGQFAHLAQMPLAIAERAILTATEPGDTVLDPYAGSGTVLEAAVRHGRQWVGVEREAQYVDLIQFRLGRYHARA